MAPSDGEYGGDIEAAARGYRDVLAANAESGAPTPVFDVHLLGMGGEGHINSLFPHTPAVRETDQMVVGVDDSPSLPPADHPDTAAVRRSRQVWLVVSGGQTDAVAAAVAGADPVDVPAAGAQGSETTTASRLTAASKLSD